MTETWPQYLRRITIGQTQAQIAERIGVGRLSVFHWLHGKTHPKAENVITVAHAYRRSPIEALLAAAYLKAEEIDQPVNISSSPQDLPANDIANEVRRRLIALERSTEEVQLR